MSLRVSLSLLLTLFLGTSPTAAQSARSRQNSIPKISVDSTYDRIVDRSTVRVELPDMPVPRSSYTFSARFVKQNRSYYLTLATPVLTPQHRGWDTYHAGESAALCADYVVDSGDSVYRGAACDAGAMVTPGNKVRKLGRTLWMNLKFSSYALDCWVGADSVEMRINLVQDSVTLQRPILQLIEEMRDTVIARGYAEAGQCALTSP